MPWYSVLWLVLLFAFLIAEASTVTLTSLWFAAGSLAALAVSLLGGKLWLQGAVFLSVSLVCLWLLRPILQKYVKPKIVATGVDALTGKTAAALEDITQDSGRVKVDGMEWSARSVTRERIPQGTQVKIHRVEGVKLMVSPAEEPVSTEI